MRMDSSGVSAYRSIAYGGVTHRAPFDGEGWNEGDERGREGCYEEAERTGRVKWSDSRRVVTNQRGE